MAFRNRKTAASAKNIVRGDELLKFALEFSREGIWTWDLTTSQVSYSPRWKELLGYAADPQGTLEEWTERIHPDYRAHVKSLLNDHLQAKTQAFDCEYQVRCGDGEYRWVRDHGQVTARDDQGRPLFFVSSYSDVSQQRNNEARVHGLITRFQSVTHAAQLGVLEWDLPTNTVHADRKFYAQYGAKEPDFAQAREGWLGHLHPHEVERCEQELDYALLAKRQFIITFQVVWSNHQIHSLKIAADIVRDDSGKAIKLLGVQWDITREQEIDRQKSEFVSLASHQLRTPLTSIRWFTESLLEDKSLSKEQRYNAEEIYKGDLRMIDLVDSLLNVSRIELGTITINLSPVKLADLIKSILLELKPQILNRSIKVVADTKDCPKSYLADPKLMRVILLNLISNAVKYTKKAGTVRIKLEVLGKNALLGDRCLGQKSLVIVVSDNGIGIPEDQRDKIYSKVFRANNAQEEHTEGTGLGLYLLKEVVTQTGGLTWFASIEGQGSSFYVALPAAGMQKTKKPVSEED